MIAGVIAYTYDNVGNMLSQALTTSSFASTLPFVDVLDTVFDVTLSQTQTIAYSYDAANRLVSETGAYEGGGGYSVAYSYDAAGNMTGKAVNTGSGPQTYSYLWSGENRILAANAPGTANDWVGNSIMAGEGKEQHTWPVRRRTGATDNNLNILYDPDSNHVLRERAGTGMGAYRKDYVLDVVRDRVLGVVGGGNNSGGMAASTTYWYQNFRGDVRAVSDGTDTDTRSYLPTGVAVAGSADAVDFPDVRYGFQGKEVQTTGLADFENRFYAAHQGRFGSLDPIRLFPAKFFEGSASDARGLEFFRGTDFSIVRGANLVSVDATGLYYVRALFLPDSCPLVEFPRFKNAMAYIKNTLNTSCVGGNLNTKMKTAYDKTTIGCRKMNGICGKTLWSQEFVISPDSVLRQSEDCNYNFGLQLGNATRSEFLRVLVDKKLRGIIFHEMIHEARFTPLKFYFDLDHKIISRCTYQCRNSLGVPTFSAGDDTFYILGARLSTSKCSYSGN